MGRPQPLDQFGTPLRYPGGKGRLSQYVCDLIGMNDLVGGHYAEPYAGGAAIGITLMYLEYVSHIHLNDLNKPVFSFWKSACENTEELVRLVRDKKPTMAEWKRQRAVLESKNASPLELGFATLFLNRTNHSGIIWGGVIGGKDQSGPWKVDARYDPLILSKKIEKIGRFAPRINLYNLDAEKFISKHVGQLPKKSLIYFDPPYYVKGKKLYENHYEHADHERLSKLVRHIKQKWIVSYDNARPIRQFYSSYEKQTFGIHYTAQDRYNATEIMVFCPALKRPRQIETFRGVAA